MSDIAPNLREVPFEGRELTEEEENELLGIVEDYLTRALSDERKPTERAKIWRKVVSLEPRPFVPYEGAPNVTTPLTRQKVDGIKAHIYASIDQQQLFIVHPHTERAQQAAPHLEAIMHRTIELTGSRREILKAIRDAVEVGTGHLKHVVVVDRDGNRIPASRYVPFEHVFVYPSASVRPEHVNYFERYYEPYYEIRRKAEAGIYWEERAEKILSDRSESDMNEQAEVWECWVRYKGELYEVRYSREHGTMLAYRKSEWGRYLDRAPYDPIYVEQNPLSYWGDSVAGILSGLQDIADKAFNYELARAQFALNPPIIVSPTSAIARRLRTKGMWRPGEIIEGSANPREDIFIPLQQMNPFEIQLLQLAGKMAEEATISDLLIPGQALGGRKTATEVNAITSVGALKLRNYLSSVADGLRRHVRAKWVLIALYVIQQEELAFTSEFEWDVNGRETIPEQQQRLQQAQYLLNPAFVQVLQLSLQDPFMRQVVEMLLSYLDLPGLGAMYRRMVHAQQNVGPMPQAPGAGAGTAPGGL